MFKWEEVSVTIQRDGKKAFINTPFKKQLVSLDCDTKQFGKAETIPNLENLQVSVLHYGTSDLLYCSKIESKSRIEFSSTSSDANESLQNISLRFWGQIEIFEAFPYTKDDEQFFRVNVIW